jgi:hypothetical protein
MKHAGGHQSEKLMQTEREGPMQGKRWRRWLLGGMAILAVLALIQVLVWPRREPYLLERATRLAIVGQQDYPFQLWLSSHEVLLYPSSQNALVIDIATGARRTVNNGSRELGELMGHAPQFDRQLTDQRILTYLDGNRSPRLRLSRDQLSRAQAINAHLPVMRIVEGLGTSPDGKRAAYLLQAWRSMPLDGLDRLMQLFRRHVTDHQRSVFVLCLSDANGGDMHEIAAEPIPEQVFTMHSNVSWPHNLQFTPDGKHVSFLYKGALWLLPVE